MKNAFKNTAKTYQQALPIMISLLLLVNLLNPLLQDVYPKVFSGNLILDPLIGALLGSISFGMPLLSFIIGGELLRVGISLLAVTAFMLTWTMVGVAMLPLEAKFLGRRFAIARNGLNFIFSIVIAMLAVAILHYV